ncbi:MAG: polyprenyl diphosphate synthase [Defluviitaleaceae bacterium]|nr:polyprenyl diphosphate synthase [Defluviitaleaceae bacterium]
MKPTHLGVIMDGNRRWAKAHAFELHRGHDTGAKTFGHLCEWCLQDNIPYLTVYAFSTENWKRNEREVRHLFGLMEKYFIEEKENCAQKGIKITIIGDRSRFDARVLSIIEGIETATAHCTKLTVQIALSYGGRDEIVRATKKIAAKVAGGVMTIDDITEESFASCLDTAGVPDVDLVIRTGGAENHRMSNFLPWQTVYAEWFFSDLLWPDFSQEEFRLAVAYYNSIKRKLGE